MKEGGGDDHLAIAWQYPGQPMDVVPAEFSRVINPYLAGATLDVWMGINGLTIEDLASGTNNLAVTPDKSERLVDSLEAPTNAGDNYGTRMSGWLVPPFTGDYEFWIASDDHGEFWLVGFGTRAEVSAYFACCWAGLLLRGEILCFVHLLYLCPICKFEFHSLLIGPHEGGWR